MPNEILLPSSDAADAWNSFLAEWHAANGLGYDSEELRRGLRALVRHWPGYWQRINYQHTRGLAVLVPAIDAGLFLADVESIQGFDEVLRRVTSDERSAYSEVILVGALCRLGYGPKFASPRAGKVLDASCCVEDQSVYFEVVAPEVADASQTDMDLSMRLSTALQHAQLPGRIEVEMLENYSDDLEQSLLERARGSADSEWVEWPGIAWIRRIYPGSRLQPLFEGDGAQIHFLSERDTQGPGSSVVVRHESSDQRAKRVFNEEYHQFPEDVPNVLVVNVSAVSDGFRDWPSHMARLLQPTRNRKVGAVLFFDQGILGPPERIRRRWLCLFNPHAHFAVPDSLLRGFESLDEQAFYGLPRLSRVTAGA